VPQHIAIIMDGNNRWARRSGVPGVLGHRAGVEAVRRALEACNARGIKTLTLFAFSSENWGRPEPEVRALLALFVRYLRGEVKKLNEDGIRLKFIGRRDRFSPNLQKLMHHGETLTANNTEVTLVLAMDYGGRWDVTQAVRTIADAVAAGTLKTEDISEHTVADELLSNQFPEPDLCIRTGGNQRLSNFLLWEFAYTEFVFSDTLWPDFNECDLDAALNDFCQRDRRFGLRESDGRGQQG
tara:strand:- start:119 stop:838 length:720 start_codon:yes stop_codon:yes gene_type:complete